MSNENSNEKSINYDTLRHIESVRNLLNCVIVELLNRAKDHDKTKMEDPELSYFVEFTPRLKECTYGSEEYKGFLKELKPALDHHYAKYRHHPEHFPNGMNDMNLIDLIELFCDWTASSRRHNDGNILKSIEINRSRFNMPDMLVNIFKNTSSVLEQLEK